MYNFGVDKWFSFLLGEYVGVKLTNEELPDCFPKWLHYFTIPPAVRLFKKSFSFKHKNNAGNTNIYFKGHVFVSKYMFFIFILTIAATTV